MPKINYGAAFNAPSAWEFSHFFGLNNLVSAGSRLPGESSAGVSSVISLNPTVLTNPQGLTCDALTTDPAPPINAIVLPDHDGSVMGSIYTALNKTNVTFAAAGNFSQKSDTVRQYSELMFDSFIKKSTQFRTDTKRYSDILQDLGKQQFTESGINPKERLMAIQTVNDLQAVGSKLFKLYMESRRMLMELM